MRKTTLRVPAADPQEPAVITFSFRDDPADFGCWDYSAGI
ncbi:MAG: hypothetical protein JWM19_3746 [Actinomycetia bacterium]|nr:hypothetical protein [Actinomycetes bacterium]